MKAYARTINAGDRLVLNDDGKRSSWHVNEMRKSGKGAMAVVIVVLDRTIRGEKQRCSREYTANERVELTKG